MQNYAQSLNIPETEIQEVQASSGLDVFDLNFIFEQFFYILNYFALAWSIFFTVVFLIDFFNSRIFNSGGELAVEKVGTRSIRMALNLWYRYYLVLFFLILFSLFRQNFLALPFLILGILSVFYKLWQDLLEILEIIGYFSIPSKIASSIQESLTFKK